MQQEINKTQQPAQSPTAEQPQSPQNANSGFEAQETMQGDGVAQPQENSADAPIMEKGGEVKQSDGLDWGLVFTFFNFKDE
jgi:hypothetical protein